MMEDCDSNLFLDLRVGSHLLLKPIENRGQGTECVFSCFLKRSFCWGRDKQEVRYRPGSIEQDLG